MRLLIQTSDSMAGTSMSTPTTVASAALDLAPYTATATATAISKKLEQAINVAGPARS